MTMPSERAGAARVVLVDHHDSYSTILAHLVGAVTGALPVVVQHDEVTVHAVLDAGFTHVVLSPGPGHPSDPADFAVGRDVLATARVPVLGVCLGMQAMVVACGGTVEPVEPAHGRRRHGHPRGRRRVVRAGAGCRGGALPLAGGDRRAPPSSRSPPGPAPTAWSWVCATATWRGPVCSSTPSRCSVTGDATWLPRGWTAPGERRVHVLGWVDPEALVAGLRRDHSRVWWLDGRARAGVVGPYHAGGMARRRRALAQLARGRGCRPRARGRPERRGGQRPVRGAVGSGLPRGCRTSAGWAGSGTAAAPTCRLAPTARQPARSPTPAGCARAAGSSSTTAPARRGRWASVEPPPLERLAAPEPRPAPPPPAETVSTWTRRATRRASPTCSARCAPATPTRST